ncbi:MULTISPECIES: DUF3099 domain-containing protein [unclassified Microbacterium]|uniref:DUF3099 domain-containing protein n=1 Tax=unclassified Microbacterium TaxID=2609290 RepID=UPI00214B7407|nr:MULTISPECIES: DUF3099 domain-containing protein [unclassified Microbacterium]MCR2785788.1 DUF3099 domain-containing protein [Microbacterium sp. zg.B96]WIM17232.1 DUF3099 domain-containing protein [Microbacterium sp. zg-B96]
MKKSTRAQSATSLPPAPRDDASSRMTTYYITMGVRAACFVLMVLITPYGWHTAVLALGAIVLPYFAVVLANVGKDTRSRVAENPERAITAAAAPPPSPAERPDVIRLDEQPPSEPGAIQK